MKATPAIQVSPPNPAAPSAAANVASALGRTRIDPAKPSDQDGAFAAVLIVVGASPARKPVASKPLAAKPTNRLKSGESLPEAGSHLPPAAAPMPPTAAYAASVICTLATDTVPSGAVANPAIAQERAADSSAARPAAMYPSVHRPELEGTDRAAGVGESPLPLILNISTGLPDSGKPDTTIDVKTVDAGPAATAATSSTATASSAATTSAMTSAPAPIFNAVPANAVDARTALPAVGETDSTHLETAATTAAAITAAATTAAATSAPAVSTAAATTATTTGSTSIVPAPTSTVLRATPQAMKSMTAIGDDSYDPAVPVNLTAPARADTSGAAVDSPSALALREVPSSEKHPHAEPGATLGSAAGDAAAVLSQPNSNSNWSVPADAGSTPTLQIHDSVDSGEFGQSLANRVSWLLGSGMNGAKLQVNPPQLGPIELRISVQGDHAQVWMATHSAVTRDALESSVSTLRDMLGAQGFGQVSVDISQRSFQERSPHSPPYTPPHERVPVANRDSVAAPAGASNVNSLPRSSLGALDAYA